MKTKLIVLTVLFVIVASAFTGCGALGSPANPVAADAGATATAMIANAQTQIASSPTLPVEQQVQTAIAMTQTAVSTPSAMPTLVPTQTSSAAQPQSSCPQARDLGPWAPSAPGQGETFEVTASDQGASNLSSNGVVLGLWWPDGKTSWGTKEITTFVPRGMSITVINGAGRGWDYETNCSSTEVKTQMDEHMNARKNDTSYHGFIALEDLISAGLVEVRFDRRVASNPTMTATP